MIYLIVCEENNTCKIGYSLEFRNRLIVLQTGNPFKLKLVSTIEGTEELEKLVHEEFKHHHIAREWFNYHPEIKEFFDNPKDIWPKLNLKEEKDKLFEHLRRYTAEFACSKSLLRHIAENNHCSLDTHIMAFAYLVSEKKIIQIAKGIYIIKPKYVKHPKCVNPFD